MRSLSLINWVGVELLGTGVGREGGRGRTAERGAETLIFRRSCADGRGGKCGRSTLVSALKKTQGAGPLRGAQREINLETRSGALSLFFFSFLGVLCVWAVHCTGVFRVAVGRLDAPCFWTPGLLVLLQTSLSSSYDGWEPH